MRLNKNLPGTQITDEVINRADSTALKLFHDTILDDGSLQIRTAAGGGGTLLTEVTHYVLSDTDATLTTEAANDVWRKVAIISGTYQNVPLYVTYKTVGDYVDATNFGTAAAADLTTSATDTTAGRVYRTQDFPRETGTWTPNYVPESGSNFATITYSLREGRYVRVGKVVYIRFALRTSAVDKTGTTSAAAMKITGAPFAGQGVEIPLALGRSENFVTNHPDSAENISSDFYLRYRTTANGANTYLTVADISTGANGNYIEVAGVYEIA